jgi:mono/diheme cytochrome c family protein
MWRSSGVGPRPAIFLALLLSGCTQYPSGGNIRLHLDMVDQPSYRPQRDPRPLPEGSIPLAAEPLPPDPDRGRRLFGIYCAACHGPAGRGDGPVAAKISKPKDLLAPEILAAKNGHIFNVIRAGQGLMPPLAETMWPQESRDVVDYVRALQKR